jgi:hypothetical protein
MENCTISEKHAMCSAAVGQEMELEHVAYVLRS